jgi:RWD domain
MIKNSVAHMSVDSSYSQLQSPLENRINEIEVLESIYGEELMKVLERPSENKPGHIQILIVPQVTRNEENFCWVILDVKYSKTYPLTMPDRICLTSDDKNFPERAKNQ